MLDPLKNRTEKPIRVLIVDDSALIRRILNDILREDPGIEVVGMISDGRKALEAVAKFNPDVVTLDVEMPEMNGIETLKRIMKESPKPVVMISAFTESGAELTFQALDLGAVDFITKPHSVFSSRLLDLRREIVLKIKEASRARVRRMDAPARKAPGIPHSTPASKTARPLARCNRIVSIGISTGGPKALGEIMPQIPADFPAAIVIVQHMPQPFTKALASRLNAISRIEVKEAEDQDIVAPGRAFVARGDYHIRIREEKLAFVACLDQAEKVSMFRPSIDVLMESTANAFRDRNIGILMTGMGRDGVLGVRKVKLQGGVTLAQNERTSAIFGMNRIAIESGYIDRVLPLEALVPAVLDLLN
jgi:two-component system, chemotaxis family, protein-glutamate methylesterase/glutaminase